MDRNWWGKRNSGTFILHKGTLLIINAWKNFAKP